MKTNIEEAREILAHASTGSAAVYRHYILHSFLYTENVKRIAAVLGGYWLIDAIASHQFKVREKLRRLGLRDFQVWALFPDGEGAALEAWTDTPRAAADESGPASVCLARQAIPYTDFPLSGEIVPEGRPFVLYVENAVLCLPAER